MPITRRLSETDHSFGMAKGHFCKTHIGDVAGFRNNHTCGRGRRNHLAERPIMVPPTLSLLVNARSQSVSCADGSPYTSLKIE